MRRFHEGGVLYLTRWIPDYKVHLASHGYKAGGISRRLKYLRCFSQFVQAKGLGALQEFLPDQTAEFADYWVHHYPWAMTVYGFTGKSRLQLHHHQALQYSLRAFFRWASSSGRMRRDPLALPPPVRKIYSFPEAPEYLQFCREHKGVRSGPPGLPSLLWPAQNHQPDRRRPRNRKNPAPPETVGPAGAPAASSPREIDTV